MFGPNSHSSITSINAFCEQTVSQPVTIYADYQATTPVDPRVLDKMAPVLGRNRSAIRTQATIFVGWRASEAVREAADSVAGLIGADADEVIFTSGATESNNLALQGLARRAPEGRDRILVSAIEHKCVLAAARALPLENHGISVETIPVDQRMGLWNSTHWRSFVDERVVLASVMAVNNEVGTIQDIPRIAELFAPYEILFHCDAAQAPCATDVSELSAHADLISLSAHKFYGPQGIGALYIRRGLRDFIEPMIYGGGQQEGLRSGTVPMPLCVGMGAAAEIVGSDEGKEERATGRRPAGFVHSPARKRGIPLHRQWTTRYKAAILATPTSALKVVMRKISSASCSRD